MIVLPKSASSVSRSQTQFAKRCSSVYTTIYQDYELVSHITFVVCIYFVLQWRDVQFKIDSERQVFEKLCTAYIKLPCRVSQKPLDNFTCLHSRQDQKGASSEKIIFFLLKSTSSVSRLQAQFAKRCSSVYTTIYQDYELVSHITFVVCVYFVLQWRDVQFKIDSERQVFEKLFTAILCTLASFCQKSAERKTPKKYFFIFSF